MFKVSVSICLLLIAKSVNGFDICIEGGTLNYSVRHRYIQKINLALTKVSFYNATQ